MWYAYKMLKPHPHRYILSLILLEILDDIGWSTFKNFVSFTFFCLLVFFKILDVFNYVLLILFIKFKSEQVFLYNFDIVNNFPNMRGFCLCFSVWGFFLVVFLGAFFLFFLHCFLFCYCCCLHLVWQDALYCNHAYER